MDDNNIDNNSQKKEILYKTLEEKETAIDEVKGVLDAVSIIEDSILAYKEKFAK